MNNYSGIMTFLIEDIESCFKKEYGGCKLNRHMDFEIEQIQMNIFIYQKRHNSKYYYNLSSKNFKYIANKNDTSEPINFFRSSYFDTILDLIENILYVKTNYTFHEKMLCSPKQKEKILKLKKSLSLFPKNNECSVCYETTQQSTMCNHAICLHCRDKCIQLRQYNCPICRKENLTIYPRTYLFTL